MPRRKKTIPNYSHHKPTGQAYVRFLDGLGGRKTVYLGPYDSPESRREYARIVAELAATPGPAAVRTPAEPAAGHSVTVNEVLLAFWRHAERHYRRPDGTPTDELAQYRQTFRLVKELYGHTPATEFGPRALKSLRQRMIDVGWTRKLVNQRVGRVRRVFKWAAAEEMLPVSVFQALGTLPGLQVGRTEARRPTRFSPSRMNTWVQPSPTCGPRSRRWSGSNSSPACAPARSVSCGRAIWTRRGAVWLFRPVQYKTRHRNKPRIVAVGPRAQAVLAAFTPADPSEFYFSPRRVVEQLHAERAANRRTPRYASHMKRNQTKRVAVPAKRPAARYTVTSYGRAVGRAVVRANGRRARLAGAHNFDPVPHWHPNQLRHAHGTEVRRLYGLEAAQVALGHERADVTQMYAEKNLALAVKVATEVG